MPIKWAEHRAPNQVYGVVNREGNTLPFHSIQLWKDLCISKSSKGSDLFRFLDFAHIQDCLRHIQYVYFFKIIISYFILFFWTYNTILQENQENQKHNQRKILPVARTDLPRWACFASEQILPLPPFEAMQVLSHNVASLRRQNISPNARLSFEKPNLDVPIRDGSWTVDPDRYSKVAFVDNFGIEKAIGNVLDANTIHQSPFWTGYNVHMVHKKWRHRAYFSVLMSRPFWRRRLSAQFLPGN